ncbi:MAG: metallophosphoesterase [Clostridia bacterium]|nr:metallophosphoesterase [Clostridia bacterium]
MSLYVISDIHLSTNETTNKSMEKFGTKWKDYHNKLEKYFRAIINDDDTVVIPGDISWAMTLEEAKSDFKFLDSLPGTKIIGKGNHDFWWSTASKIHSFFAENEITTIKLLHNNAYLLEDCIICGSRGWFYDEKQQKTVGEVDYEKIVSREAQRLEISLSEALKIKNDGNDLPILVFLHFPPVYADCVCDKILDVLKKYEITTCYYGHIHNNYSIPRQFVFDGITFTMVAADYLNFAPMPIFL